MGFNVGDLNDQRHSHTCVKFKLAILNLAIFENFCLITKLKPCQSFLLYGMAHNHVLTRIKEISCKVMVTAFLSPSASSRVPWSLSLIDE